MPKMNLWVAFSLIAAFILLCPIFLTIYLYTDLRSRKSWFAFYVLRYIKLHGGYAALYRAGVAFHLTNKKAVLLPYKEMLGANKKFRITRGFRMLAYSHVFEAGSRENAAGALALSALMQSGTAVACGVLRKRKKCRSFKADTLFYTDADVLKLSQRVVLVFNLFIVLAAAAKLLLRKILEVVAAYEQNKQKQKSK